MAVVQKYGIKYPFTSDNLDEVYLDMNETYEDSIKSQVLHVAFTPKGTKLRDPDFGTNLISYVFGQKDSETTTAINAELTTQINKYVPAAVFESVDIYSDEKSDNGIIVSITYTVQKGNKKTRSTVAVKL